MNELLVTRLLPALVFAVAFSGLLWLIGLARKRATLACALALALFFVAAGWNPTLLASLQLALAGAAGRILLVDHRLRLRDVAGLTGAAVILAGAVAVRPDSVYWNAALAGALAGALGAWCGRAGTVRWGATPARRLLSLGRAGAGGFNGPGAVTGVIVATAIAGASMRLTLVGPGEPALVVIGAVVGTGVADAVLKGRPGLVLVAGSVAAAATAALTIGLP